MPAKSRRQQRYLYARFGKAWLKRHHFNRLAKGGRKKGGSKRRRRKH